MKTREIREITISITVNQKVNSTHAQIQASNAHLDLLVVLKQQFPDVLITNNKNQQENDIINEVEGWKVTPLTYQTKFVMHPKRTKNSQLPRFQVLHRIATTASLREIKNNDAINQFLKAKTIYLQTHPWNETVHDTNIAAYIVGMPPKYFPTDVVRARIHQMVKEINPSTTIPMFQILPARPSITYDGHRYAAPAYILEVESKNKIAMSKVLRKIYQNHPHNILFEREKNNPKQFAHIMNVLTKQYNQTYTLPLENMTQETAAFYATPLLAKNGVNHIVPSRNAATTGRYNILVDKDQFETLARTLPSVFHKMYSENRDQNGIVPDGSFPNQPQIRTNQPQDTMSDGENTNVDTVTSAVTWGSPQLTEIHIMDNPIPTSIVTKTTTYAQATNPSSVPTSTTAPAEIHPPVENTPTDPTPPPPATTPPTNYPHPDMFAIMQAQLAALVQASISSAAETAQLRKSNDDLQQALLATNELVRHLSMHQSGSTIPPPTNPAATTTTTAAPTNPANADAETSPDDTTPNLETRKRQYTNPDI